MRTQYGELDLSADMLDVRDIIARCEHLEALRQPGAVDLGEEDNATDQDTLFAELALLESVLSDLAGNGGDEQWRGAWYPITLIHDDYFVDAMRERVQDCAILPREIPSYLVIDWNKTAENMRMDYASIEIDGNTYWYC
jgi:hypothetical protein